ncbi:MAG TPA: S-layer homology domain-containing protein, partial [Ruminiclostridium sp.]|nr:S-layer homology domain-containing protein [Ruminiclostridium sp.]
YICCTSAGTEKDDVKFKPITARYVRVSGVMATQYGLSTYEFEVYGDYSYKLDNHEVTLNKGDTLELKALLSPYSSTDSIDFKSYNTDAVTVAKPVTVGTPETGGQATYSAALNAVSGGTSVIIARHSAGSEYDLCTVKVNTYKDDLQALYDMASKFDQNDYISSSWTDSDIDNALPNANSVLGDSNATQRQVDAAIQKLETSINTLVKKADKASLVEVISQVKTLKQADYTPESWANANFEKLLADANLVYFNDYATQQEVNISANALIAAMNGLVKVTIPEEPSLITLDSTSKSVYRGQDFTITATVTSSSAIDKKVQFSTNSDAVTVGETEFSTPAGISIVHLKAAKVGNAIITATTTGGGIARCAVNVLPVSVTLDQTSKTLYPGDSFTLTATVVPEDAVDKEVSFRIGNDMVSLGTPSFDAQTGTTTIQVNAIRTGTTTITATTSDGGTAQCVVRVQPYISDDDSHGGNGGGVSGNSSPVITPTAPVSNITVSDTSTPGHDSVTGTIAAETKTDKDGKAIVAVTGSDVAEAIKRIFEAAAKMDKGTAANLEIKISVPAGAKAVEVTLPKDAADKVVTENIDAMTISTSIAVITFDKESAKTISKEATGDVKITVSRADGASLSDEASQAVGDRPVLNLAITSGDKAISEFTGNVTVSIPYTSKAGEDTEAIVIYYINSQGKLEPVSNCLYNKESGMISFKTNNLSNFAVGYNKISFNDVAADAWYSKAVGFIAARGISTGTGNGKFSPGEKLTRGEFLTMVMKANGMKADEKMSDNFIDAGNKYYTGYLAAAKRLGISDGVGNNRFAPEKEITREEMFTLLYNILKLTDELPAGNSGKSLEEFSDTNDISAWAKPAMSMFAETGILGGDLGKLSPKVTTNRAQMAQVLYNLIKTRME